MVVIARLQAAPGKEATLEQVFAELSAQVRKNEPGCQLYSLCTTKVPGAYVVVERYVDKAAFAAHGDSEHFKAAGAKLGACLAAAPQLEFLRELP